AIRPLANSRMAMAVESMSGAMSKSPYGAWWLGDYASPFTAWPGRDPGRRDAPPRIDAPYRCGAPAHGGPCVGVEQPHAEGCEHHDLDERGLPHRDGQVGPGPTLGREKMGPRRAELAESNGRIGLTRESWHLQPTPNGALLILSFEANDLAGAFEAYAAQD